jgi:hypothetical protein
MYCWAIRAGSWLGFAVRPNDRLLGKLTQSRRFGGHSQGWQSPGSFARTLPNTWVYRMHGHAFGVGGPKQIYGHTLRLVECHLMGLDRDVVRV